MQRVANLSAHEAATRAHQLWHSTFEEKASLEFLYYALTEDKSCPKAILVLTNGLSLLAGEKIAAVVAGYAYDIVTDETIKSRIKLIRRVELNQLHLLSHPSAKMTELPIEEWEHSSEFVVDEEGLAKVTQEVLQSHTLEQAFEAACLLVGVRAGLVVPKIETATPIDFEHCFYPENFRKADHYSSFLAAES